MGCGLSLRALGNEQCADLMTEHAQVANSRCRLAIERADVAPGLCFGLQVLDAVTNAPNPISPKSFDVSEPGAVPHR